jgi:phosphatidylglycerophosphatase A
VVFRHYSRYQTNRVRLSVQPVYNTASSSLNKNKHANTYSMTTDKHQQIPPGFYKHPVNFMALGFGSGYMPKGPGTAGTLVGVLFYYFLRDLNWQLYLIATVFLFAIGIWLCEKTTNALGVHDHGAIVWDEIVGYLITMILAPAGLLWMLYGFILFRLFDIWKPWPIRWMDRGMKGGLGIMIDDVFAGLYGLFFIQLTVYLLYS